MKTVKSLKESGLLIKSVREIDNEATEYNGGLIGMLLGTLRC